MKLEQNPSVPLFLFSLKAGQVSDVAAIFRASRLENEEFVGYQRPEAKQHVSEILEYLNGENLIFPNALVLALSPECTFSAVSDNYGKLSIPLGGEERPAWIVDGQQRSLALSRCQHSDLSVPVIAFLTVDVATMRDQFIRINNARPLPRGLLTELLPTVTSSFSAAIHRKRTGAVLCSWLAERSDSPFYGLVKRSTTRSKSAVVTDTSLINAIQSNLYHPSGCLFTYLDASTGQVKYDSCYQLLSLYWNAVKESFREAWGRPARESRLSHGVGIGALGKLMDRMLGAGELARTDLGSWVCQELHRLKGYCAWTEGRWVGLGGMAWNELQNTPSHIRLLSDLLIRTYLKGRSR